MIPNTLLFINPVLKKALQMLIHNKIIDNAVPPKQALVSKKSNALPTARVKKFHPVTNKIPKRKILLKTKLKRKF
jgi:hypothetical protein